MSVICLTCRLQSLLHFFIVAPPTKTPCMDNALLDPISWCKHQKAKQEGKLYKHRTAGLPNAVLNTVKTTYMDLCDQSPLEKCLHGKTQNANESFNGVLWSIIPKETFVELLTLQFGAFLAVLQFTMMDLKEFFPCWNIYTSQWVISF
ncbi:uncharacterized protein TNCV_2094791 [Trichonephila clavipes]|nr:uncharacterized protein TNCV_2094791 [Trichonephila clavipes]